MDLKTILKKVPRVIEKMILDDILNERYLKKHKKKFSKTLYEIKEIYPWREPEFYDLSQTKIHYMKPYYDAPNRYFGDVLKSYDNYYAVFDIYGELIIKG